MQSTNASPPPFIAAASFLIGDAAHTVNPIGGMGMNCGIHDAINLVDKFAQAQSGGDAAALFARFVRQRRTVTLKHVRDQAMANKAFPRRKRPGRAPAPLRRHAPHRRGSGERPRRAAADVDDRKLARGDDNRVARRAAARPANGDDCRWT